MPVEGTFTQLRIYYKEFRELGDIGYLGDEDDFGLADNGNVVNYDLIEEDTKNVQTNDLGTSEQWLKNPWNRLVVYHNPDESPRLETPGVLEEYGWVIDDDNPLVPIKKLKPDTWYVYAIELYYNLPTQKNIYSPTKN